MGFAGAFTAQASDPSAIFHNAAGIAFLKGNQLYLGGTLDRARRPTSPGTLPFPGAGQLETHERRGHARRPPIYYTHQFSERSGRRRRPPHAVRPARPSGRARQTFTRPLHLEEGRAARASRSTRRSAYKLADRLSVGVGLDIRFSSVTLDRNMPAREPLHAEGRRRRDRRRSRATRPPTSASTWASSPSRPRTSSIGVSYRHKVKQDYTGTADLHAAPDGQRPARHPRGRQGCPPAPFRRDHGHRVPVDPLPGRRLLVERLDLRRATSTSTAGPASTPCRSRSRAAPTSPVGRRGLRGLPPVPDRRRAAARTTPGRPGRVLLRRDPVADRVGVAAAPRRQPPRLLPRRLLEARPRPRRRGAPGTSRSKERSTEGVERDNYNGTYSGKALTLGLSLGYSF